MPSAVTHLRVSRRSERFEGRFLVVVPTYNERENLEQVVERVALVRAIAPLPGEVLVVDDGSPDGTGRLADELAVRLDWVHVLHRRRKDGLARAYLAGFEWGLARGYTHLLEMDADLSHPPEAIARLLAAGADLAVGSRYVPGGAVVGWSWRRRVVSWCGSAYARAILGLPVRDATAGFTCMTRELVEAIDPASIRSDGYVFQIELKHRSARLGARIVEVPIEFRDRTHGSSKMTLGIVLEAVWRVPWLRLRRPGDLRELAAAPTAADRLAA